ncbi:hypothetical protein Tco_0880521 [Tanacetum coccineum]
MEKHTWNVGFVLFLLREEAQVSLTWNASLAIRVRSLSDPTAKNKDLMIRDDQSAAPNLKGSLHYSSLFVPIAPAVPSSEELRDLPHKIDQTVNEAVKEAVQIALQAPLRERFRDLSKDDMKEILHDRMFESGSYRSRPKHVALYEALEASMERDNRDAFLAEKDKSRKRCQDDQDPHLPPTKE